MDVVAKAVGQAEHERRTLIEGTQFFITGHLKKSSQQPTEKNAEQIGLHAIYSA